jgi:AP-1 complex subunit gamma-1
MSIKLRDLIRSVRACKTAAEERGVISKECALIRTAIKEEAEIYRHRNVAKLMYIHMLGYPTHFGQMECLKLISAQGFPEKRIGYLGLTLLLTEQTEVLTLVTNSLKMDLSSPNQYIQALSLVAIGNLATQDMARDLASDVDKILRSNNKYLRKKASLAAIRLLKKEPDLIEQLGERIVSLLKDKAHGVLITGLQLMIEVLDLIPSMIEEYHKLVPSLVRLLRNFISMGFSPEHDVAGITDPFMQVKLLHILKRLGKNNEETSDQMNDVLAQVATNTETAKNAGNAILYECVQTIMEIESDAGLRLLAVNILGRFLLNRDNNIRYVALNSLSKVVSEDISAVQRHRSTIVECLKDGDISIRQRALELIYQLVNDQNVVSLTAELLNYLIIANTEHKANLVSKIMQLVERYSPSKKWRVDTVLTMLSMSGNQIEDSVSRTAIIYIAQAEGLQGYAAHRLFRILQDDTSQQGLLHVAVWCIGEYSDLLVKKYAATDGDGETYTAIAEASIIGMCDKCLKLYNADTTTKGLILNALMKLSVKVSPSMRHLIAELMVPFQTSMSLELQQRSSEYSVLQNSQWDSLRGELMAKMPMVDEAALKKRKAVIDNGAAAFFNDTGDMSVIKTAGDTTESAIGINVGKTAVAKSQIIASSLITGVGSSSSNVSLLDLDDIFGGGASESSTIPIQSASSFGYQQQDNQHDLLSDIFSSSTLSPSIYPPIPPKVDPIGSFNGTSNNFPEIIQNTQQSNSFLNLMPVDSSSIVIQAYDKGGLQVFKNFSFFLSSYKIFFRLFFHDFS